MLFPTTPRAEKLREQVAAFLEEHIHPAEHLYEDQLNAMPKAQGLWNMFAPKREFSDGLTNLEYAHICEVMGRSPIGSEPFNCSAPDTGNMETIARYGNAEHKEKWLKPLLEGEIRSCFAMTEPAVASSDATNIQSEIKRDGDHYVING